MIATPGPGRRCPGRLTPARLLWGALGSAVAIAAVTVPGALDAREDVNRTALRFSAHLDPAARALHELVAAVQTGPATPGPAPRDDAATAAPRPPGPPRPGAVVAAERMAALHTAAGGLPRLGAPVGDLERELSAWLAAATAPRPLPALAPAGQGELADRVLVHASRLTDAVYQEYDRARADASRAREAMGLRLTLGAAALLALLFALTTLMWCRIVLPLATLEHTLRAVASGRPGRLPAVPRRSWLAHAHAQTHRVQLVLKEERWAARRDREALLSNGTAAMGLRHILTVTEQPGPGVRSHGDTVAAEGLIAGDFLDTVALPGGATALLQGDIAGHGVQAGLLAAQVKYAALAALRLGRGPEAAVQAAWSALAHEDERFATLAVVVLDPAAGALHWLNAGHEEPFLRRATGEVERLAATGPLVGSLVTEPDGSWSVRSTAFARGDLVVLCTDGLTEARNAAGHQLGDATVATVLREGPPDPPAMVRALYLAVEEHGADWQRDDVTILAADTGCRPAPARTAAPDHRR